MNGEHRVLSTLRGLGAVTLAGLCLAGCVDLPKSNPFNGGPVNPNSPVAAETEAASHAPGPVPHFADLPLPPTDLRPTGAWRDDVIGELAQKHALETEAAQIPFVLSGTEQWAAIERAKIPASELTPPAADSADQTEAFAAQSRARATPPPPSN